MEALSVSNYRNNLASAFDRVDRGERVIIRRRNQLYALVNIEKEDISLTPAMQNKIKSMASSIRRSWNEVKQIEEGKIVGKSATDFLNEL